MTSPLIGRDTAEILADLNPSFETQPIPMTAGAASKAQSSRKTACKPRANCLKPKEIRKPAQAAAGSVLTCGNP
jgi:hypothetical protein